MRTIRGILALAGLTLREAMRQRLWLLVLAAVVGICVGVPSLKAVDDAARLKLSVALITGIMGFVTVILAILISAATVRRDLDQRVGYLLFSKPLSRFGYLAGRWLGLQLVLALTVVIFTLVGSLVVGLRLGRQPRMLTVVPATGWHGVDHLGKAKEIDPRKRRYALTGRAGNQLVFSFNDLPAAAGDGYDLLLRLKVIGERATEMISHARLNVYVADATGGGVHLRLHPDSPYGDTLAGQQPVAPGEVAIRDRPDNRTDLSQDYLRLVLPATLVRDGAVDVHVTRIDDTAILQANRASSCFVATRSGSFVANLLKAGIVVLAHSGVLCAVALCCACLSHVGVTLFASLTYFFAGNTVPIIEETLRWEKMAKATENFFNLILYLAPDFSAYPVEAKLAASRAVSWALTGEAWLYYGIYALVFFVLGWLALARREQ